MAGLVDDTIGGFNSFIEKQKLEEGKALLTTVLFDNLYEVLHDGVELKKVKPLTDREYTARGMTALYDAIGLAINTVGDRLKNTPEEDRPSKVVFVITTDGAENASREFTQKQVKEMIERQTNEYQWQFIFLGANIDAESVAGGIGISGQFASKYTASAVGTDSIYSSLSKQISNVRGVGVMNADWKSDIK